MVSFGHLALLGWPRVWGCDRVETANEQVVDRVGRGRGREAEALAQLGEDRWAFLWSQVEVAAEEQRCIARPVARRLRGAQDVLDCQLGPVVGRVQVGDAEAWAGAGEGHRPPLGAAFMDRQPVPLGDPSASDQSEVRSTLTRSDQVGVDSGGERAHGAERVA